MKKLISLMLALIMVFSLATVASAEELVPDGVYIASITKEYTTTAGNVPATFPAETLTFTVEAATGSNNADNISTIVFGEDNSFTITGTTNTIPFELSGFEVPGIWDFTVTENAPNPETQGVTYTTSSFDVQVIAYWVETTTGEGEAAVTTRTLTKDVSFTTSESNSESNAKVSKFTNKYDLGTLTVKKEVSGNLGDKSNYFTITVSFETEDDQKVMSDITYKGGKYAENQTIDGDGWTSKEVTLKLKHDDTITFSNIPAGVSYSVAESTDHEAADATCANGNIGYTVTYEDEEGTIAADGQCDAVVKNKKETKIETGIVTDSAPYIILIAVCAIAAVAFVLKRRNAVEF